MAPARAPKMAVGVDDHAIRDSRRHLRAGRLSGAACAWGSSVQQNAACGGVLHFEILDALLDPPRVGAGVSPPGCVGPSFTGSTGTQGPGR